MRPLRRRGADVVAWALAELAAGREPRSDLATGVGAKGYHREFTGPYPTR